jgi:aminoglycoside 6'-N-acetyltransferase I
MIQKAEVKDLTAIAELACQLWPHHTVEEMCSEYADVIAKPDAAFFLAYVEETAVGFAQCQLRHDYVEGTDFSPVGYLEGIYVAEGYRKRGVAKALLSACESWAKEKGCSEFASDCELDNVQSLKFHLNVGFEEANRIICFAKKL